MKIKVVKIVCFVLIFIFILNYITRILIFKDQRGIYQVDIFHKQENNIIDVLFFGSSHVFWDIDPAILYKNYGIASYNFATASAPIWHVYFSLKEALKKQIPKVILIEAYSITYDIEYSRYARILDFLYGFKWSMNKAEAIKVSSKKQDWFKVASTLPIYHNRYSKLNSMDFLFYTDKIKYSKGYNILTRQYQYQSNANPVFDISNTENLNYKMEKYYRKIIELAKSNDIPILIIVSPYLFNEYQQDKINMAKKIANEYNVPFLNFNLNYDEYSLDFSEDFADGHHLNYKGASKYTRYLGQYLKENYDLPDRRGDPKYYSWEMNAKYQDKEIYNFELKKSANLNEYIEKVKNVDDYVIGITMLGNYQKNDAVVQSIATNFNIDNIYLKNSSYVVDNNKLTYSSEGSNQYLFHEEIGSYTDLVIQNGQKLSINRRNYIKTKNGINIVIYDKFTEEIVDNIYLEYKGKTINPTIKR